jgi:hypothetical protein
MFKILEIIVKKLFATFILCLSIATMGIAETRDTGKGGVYKEGNITLKLAPISKASRAKFVDFEKILEGISARSSGGNFICTDGDCLCHGDEDCALMLKFACGPLSQSDLQCGEIRPGTKSCVCTMRQTPKIPDLAPAEFIFE